MEELGFVVFKLFVWANEDELTIYVTNKKGICSDELGLNLFAQTTICSDEIVIWLDEWGIYLDEFGFVRM